MQESNTSIDMAEALDREGKVSILKSGVRQEVSNRCRIDPNRAWETEVFIGSLASLGLSDISIAEPVYLELVCDCKVVNRTQSCVPLPYETEEAQENHGCQKPRCASPKIGPKTPGRASAHGQP